MTSDDLSNNPRTNAPARGERVLIVGTHDVDLREELAAAGFERQNRDRRARHQPLRPRSHARAALPHPAHGRQPARSPPRPSRCAYRAATAACRSATCRATTTSCWAPQGVIVLTVVPDGPANNADIPPGDVIVAYADEPVEDSLDLQRRVVATPPGTSVDVDIIRTRPPHAMRTRPRPAPPMARTSSGSLFAAGRAGGKSPSRRAEGAVYPSRPPHPSPLPPSCGPVHRSVSQGRLDPQHARDHHVDGDMERAALPQDDQRGFAAAGDLLLSQHPLGADARRPGHAPAPRTGRTLSGG